MVSIEGLDVHKPAAAGDGLARTSFTSRAAGNANSGHTHDRPMHDNSGNPWDSGMRQGVWWAQSQSAAHPMRTGATQRGTEAQLQTRAEAQGPQSDGIGEDEANSSHAVPRRSTGAAGAVAEGVSRNAVDCNLRTQGHARDCSCEGCVLGCAVCSTHGEDIVCTAAGGAVGARVHGLREDAVVCGLGRQLGVRGHSCEAGTSGSTVQNQESLV